MASSHNWYFIVVSIATEGLKNCCAIYKVVVCSDCVRYCSDFGPKFVSSLCRPECLVLGKTYGGEWHAKAEDLFKYGNKARQSQGQKQGEAQRETKGVSSDTSLLSSFHKRYLRSYVVSVAG